MPAQRTLTGVCASCLKLYVKYWAISIFQIVFEAYLCQIPLRGEAQGREVWCQGRREGIPRGLRHIANTVGRSMPSAATSALILQLRDARRKHVTYACASNSSGDAQRAKWRVNIDENGKSCCSMSTLRTTVRNILATCEFGYVDMIVCMPLVMCFIAWVVYNCPCGSHHCCLFWKSLICARFCGVSWSKHIAH